MASHPTTLRTAARSVLAAALMFVSACHSSASHPSLAEQYSTRLAPMVGHAKRDAVAAEFGIPSAKQSIGNSEVWEYRTSKGVVSGGNGSPMRPYYSHELYEKLTVMFDETGVLRSWSVETQDGVIGRG